MWGLGDMWDVAYVLVCVIWIAGGLGVIRSGWYVGVRGLCIAKITFRGSKWEVLNISIEHNLWLSLPILDYDEL